jgi:hypothetical protein
MHLDRREWYQKFNIAAFGLLDLWQGDYRAARDILELVNRSRVAADEARFEAEWFSPSAPVSAILNGVALARFVTGDAGGVDTQFERALEQAAMMAFPQGPFSTAYSLSFEAWVRIECQQFDLADKAVAAFTAIAAEHGFDGWTMVAATQHTVVAAMRELRGGSPDLGQLASHCAVLNSMIDLWKHFDTVFFLTYYLTTAGVLSAAAGDQGAARRLLEESLHLARDTEMRFYDVETLRHLARLERNRDGREELLRDALGLAKRQGSALFGLRVAADLHDLSGPGADRELEEALEPFASAASPDLYPEVPLAWAALGTPGTNGSRA